jgi:hypothetical protein
LADLTKYTAQSPENGQAKYAGDTSLPVSKLSMIKDFTDKTSKPLQIWTLTVISGDLTEPQPYLPIPSHSSFRVVFIEFQ